jgi:hypothetical protein
MNSRMANVLQVVVFTGLILIGLFFQDDVRAKFFTKDVTTENVDLGNATSSDIVEVSSSNAETNSANQPVSEIDSVQQNLTVKEGQQLTDVFTAAREADAEFSDEELKALYAFDVTYPSYGDTLVAGKEYTVAWKAGERAQYPTYTVRLANSTYATDIVLGTAYGSEKKFTFTVPTSLSGTFFLVFAHGTDFVENSEYFNITEGDEATQNSSDAPVIVYMVGSDFPEGESADLGVGDWANYEWDIKNADSYTRTETRSGCKDSTQNRTNVPLRIEQAQISGSLLINSYLEGCTVTQTITAVRGVDTSTATIVIRVK